MLLRKKELFTTPYWKLVSKGIRRFFLFLTMSCVSERTVGEKGRKRHVKISIIWILLLLSVEASKYTKRLKDDVKSILDNFTEIVKSSKVINLTEIWGLKPAWTLSLLHWVLRLPNVSYPRTFRTQTIRTQSWDDSYPCKNQVFML